MLRLGGGAARRPAADAAKRMPRALLIRRLLFLYTAHAVYFPSLRGVREGKYERLSASNVTRSYVHHEVHSCYDNKKRRNCVVR